MNETGEFSTLLRLEEPSEGGGAAFLLTVEDGPDEDAAVLVDPSLPIRIYVGTSPSCDLRLSDGDVARRHLALEAIGQRLRVTDLGSTNGTSANGVVILDGFMRGGETLRIGRTTLRVERREGVDSGVTSRAERFGRIIGASPEMQRLYPLCERLSMTSGPVMIEGEPGTGKELLAEALHEQGPRARNPFVVFDCTSESFATEERKRVFDQAQGGTLLLDEVSDLDLAVQAKLLAVLDRANDVRVLVTTKRDLDRLVEVGRFREDLFERLCHARIELPALRRRTGDVRRLALHFAREIGGPAATLPPDLVAQWESDPWPGNVRALRKAVARWLTLDELAVEMTSPGTIPPAPKAAPGGVLTDPFLEDVLAQGLPLVQAREKVVAELERRFVERILADHGGRVADAASASGLARRYFQRSGTKARLSSPDE